MEPYQRVTVALARAEGDAELLAYARRLAELGPGARFHFVHVLDWQPAARDAAPPVSHDRALGEIAAAVKSGFGSGADYRVLSGSRLDRLLEFAVESRTDLLLVGHRRGRSGRRSLARRLAMQAPCSLWMAPENSAPVIRGVLCAIDFSDHSAVALSTAARLAQRAGLEEVRTLHVFFDEFTAGLEDFETIARGQEAAAFERFVAPLELHGVRLRPSFELGASVSHAASRLAAAEGLDLIVMGTRGQSRAAGILLGSESEQVLMETPVPALVVKLRGERLSVLEALFDRSLAAGPEPQFG